MDDIAEQQDLANEISQAISTPIGGRVQRTPFIISDQFVMFSIYFPLFGCVGYNYDDEELEKELLDLEQEQLDEELLSTGTHAHDQLPEVPSGDIKSPAIAEKKKGKQR